MDALQLLSGDAQAFVDEVWASRVLLHRTDADALAGVLSLDAVDHLLTGTALRTPALRVVRDGTVLPSSRFTRQASISGSPLTGLVDARKVLAEFEQGATLVLQGLHRYWPPLTRMVRELELALGHPCQANAYLTPPGSQGFARHSDTHDVFVFQTHGQKLWEVVEDAGSEDDPREVLLEPGLAMYLPTGTPHSARSQEHTSLHVTIGINRLTWRDVLRKVTDGLLAEERYDEPLSAGYLHRPDLLADRLGDELTGLAEQIAGTDPAQVAEARAASFLSGRTPALRGGLVDLVELDLLSDDTLLERRPTATCVLRPSNAGPGRAAGDGERLSVLLGDRELRMPARLREPMEFVRDHTSFQVGDLSPWLDASSRLVVARRLVREGLLRIAT